VIEPGHPWLGVVIESKCNDVNPEVTQRRITLGPKDKIERDRYTEEDNKSWQNPESSFCVEPAEVLANRQRLHLQKAVGNEITGQSEKDPQPNPAKTNITEVIRKNQNHTDPAQTIERGQMSLAGIHRLLLKRIVSAVVVQSVNSANAAR